MRCLSVLILIGSAAWSQGRPSDYLNHGRPLLDSHNCYPERGHWGDRIDRALAVGFPVGIEQDLAWHADQVVVSHEAKTNGSEPPLRQYFFERVRPIVEKALAENDRSRWPLIVLHFDFKSNDEPLLRAVWQLLGEYEGWITTARKTANQRELSPFEPRPLLVLTEDSDAQEKVFFNDVPVGGRLRLFGSAHSRAMNARSDSEREHLEATVPPEELLVSPPTNYRRWWNNSWYIVEEGGQRRAGTWSQTDEQRLRALVDHAHALGYWIRFYTLDGFTPAEDRGWGASYNFGSRDAVTERWKAAIRAGVDLIATDQYEDLAKVMK